MHQTATRLGVGYSTVNRYRKILRERGELSPGEQREKEVFNRSKHE